MSGFPNFMLLHDIQDAPHHVRRDLVVRDCHGWVAIADVRSRRARRPCFLPPPGGGARARRARCASALHPEGCQGVALGARAAAPALQRPQLRAPEEGRLQRGVGACTPSWWHGDQLVQHQHAVWTKGSRHTHDVLEDLASVRLGLTHQGLPLGSSIPVRRQACDLSKAETRVDGELGREVLHGDHLWPRGSRRRANQTEDPEQVVDL
mmetsp:Transcript_24083/g.74862  ORF Transcript_24083/g.74862 Transcript_24083/m.74862 type:complete len:208 (-) Transcript_24083:1135-1758(-)